MSSGCGERAPWGRKKTKGAPGSRAGQWWTFPGAHSHRWLSSRETWPSPPLSHSSGTLSGMSSASRGHLPLRVVVPREGGGRLTVHGDLDGRAAALADGVFHHTAVQVVILHEHTRDGEHLLVWRQEHPRVVEEGLAILQPGVAGFGAVLVRAVQGEGLAELQHRG